MAVSRAGSMPARDKILQRILQTFLPYSTIKLADKRKEVQQDVSDAIECNP